MPPGSCVDQLRGQTEVLFGILLTAGDDALVTGGLGEGEGCAADQRQHRRTSFS